MASRRQTQSLIRLIDASSNRAVEGLRVAEEIVRFHFQSPRLFARSRRLRHAVNAAVRKLPLQVRDLVAARNSHEDVGRAARAGRVDSLERLLLINLQRAKESLRSLEECSRLIDPRHTRTFQRLRFGVYELERDLVLRLATVRHRRPRRHR